MPTEAVDQAIREICKPDAYFLAECKKPRKITDDRLEYVIKWVGEVLAEYAECDRKHKALVDQIDSCNKDTENKE